MTKRLLRACGLVTTLVAVTALTSGPTQAADHQERMQGAWRVVSAEVGGKKATEAELKGFEVLVEGGKFTLVEGGKKEVVHFTLSPTARPHGIEFFKTEAKKDKIWHGIYAFEAEELKLCWGPAEHAQPKHFEATEKDHNRYFILKKK